MSEFTTTAQKIYLTNLILPFQIGIHDFEQGNKQRVAINLELTLSSDVAPEFDSIETTVDYDYLRTEITRMSEERDFNLQETLCKEIVGVCFQDSRVASVIARTSKIDVYPDCDAVSFEMTATRAV